MITVTIHRRTLERLDACADGLALYGAIAALQPESDARRHLRIKIREWTALHSVWPYVAGYGAFVRWLEDRGVVPRANLAGAYLAGANLVGAYLAGAYLVGAYLAGANLAGAYRRASPAIPGWRTLATGYLEREEVSRAAE